MKKLIVFASGSGTNAENIVNYFNSGTLARVSSVLTNKPDAGVLQRCDRLGIPALYFNKHAFLGGTVLDMLRAEDPDLIVLAGFLWKIPADFIAAFPNKIINIHPALLPKFGGKGMYGNKVHEAVKKSGEVETGITIHYLNEQYDEGAIIHQAKTEIDQNDSVKAIAEKVHTLEYEHYPQVIEKLLASPDSAKSGNDPSQGGVKK